MKCSTQECTNDACAHLTFVEGRDPATYRALCEVHADSFLEALLRRAPSMPRSAQTASEFQVELELLMYDDKTMKSSIYLRERGGQRLLRIDSGYQEASILNTLLTVVSIPRPLTHHAFLNTIRALGGELVRVLIDDFDNATSVFYSKLVIRTRLALSSVLVDSRPSDAIALALVAKAPIMVSPTAMRKIDLRERITKGE